MMWQTLIQSIEKTVQTVDQKMAVFDADGTLWPEDLGHDFFHYQIKHQLIEKPPWLEQFDSIYKKNPSQACAFIVQCNQGVLLEDYRQWFKYFLKETPLNVFSFQRDLIEILHKLKVQIFIISASPKWLVEEALNHYDLSVHKTIGIETKIVNGKITDQLLLPLSIKEGKVESFLNTTNQTYPFLVSSNSMSDLSLMNIATHIQWVVAKAQKGERQYNSEQKLLALAKEKNWFYTE